VRAVPLSLSFFSRCVLRYCPRFELACLTFVSAWPYVEWCSQMVTVRSVFCYDSWPSVDNSLGRNTGSLVRGVASGTATEASTVTVYRVSICSVKVRCMSNLPATAGGKWRWAAKASATTAETRRTAESHGATATTSATTTTTGSSSSASCQAGKVGTLGDDLCRISELRKNLKSRGSSIPSGCGL